MQRTSLRCARSPLTPTVRPSLSLIMLTSLLPALLLASFAGGCVSMFALQDQDCAVLAVVLAEDPNRPGHPLLEARDLATFTDLPFTFTAFVSEPYFHAPGQLASPASTPKALLLALQPANRLGVSIPRALRRRVQPHADAQSYVAVSRPAFSADRTEALVAVSAHPKVAGCGWGYLVHLRLIAGTWHVVGIGGEYVT